jgi:hypothetical protein
MCTLSEPAEPGMSNSLSSLSVFLLSVWKLEVLPMLADGEWEGCLELRMKEKKAWVLKYPSTPIKLLAQTVFPPSMNYSTVSQ